MASNTASRSSMAHPLSTPQKINPLGQAFLALILGFALLAAMVALIHVVYGYAYEGKIYQGVAVAGVDLSGLTKIGRAHV